MESCHSRRGIRARAVRSMLTKKLASSVWNPSAVSITPGTTRRIVLRVVEVAEAADTPLVDGSTSSRRRRPSVDGARDQPALERHDAGNASMRRFGGSRRSRIANVFATERR